MIQILNFNIVEKKRTGEFLAAKVVSLAFLSPINVSNPSAIIGKS